MNALTEDPDEMSSGVVFSSSSVSVYVSDQADMPADEAATKAKQMHASTPDSVVPLESHALAARDHVERARLLALIDDTVGGGLDVELTDVDRSNPETARIPIQVAAEGKPLIAAYLAAFGVGNSAIADVLDVGNRTVSQYISDFKAGER